MFCVALVNVGVDIQDNFKMSDDAISLYLKGIKNNLRKSFVAKEAYCKLIGNFDDEYFKNIDINSISENKYEINNIEYDLVLFYEGSKKKIDIIL